MLILQISDTHNRHSQLIDMPAADVIVHCGDFTDSGTEKEVLDFLNWFIELPYQYKIFVTGNHDFCLWDADNIEDLPENVFFLQDRGCEINGVKFFGIAYNHNEKIIPEGTDVIITHEPPAMILDKANGRHWGNLSISKVVSKIKPHYHLFGHVHDGYGVMAKDGIVYSNASSLDDQYVVCHPPKLFCMTTRPATP